MKVTRLPGIHHDGNIVVVSGTAGCLVIDAGTSWYQSLQVERIEGLLKERPLDRILLTSRRFPVSGGAHHLAQAFNGVPVHIHPEGRAALERGDFFTTWANRFDSDMPPTTTSPVTADEVFVLGDGEVHALALPGHAPDGMGYRLPHVSTLVVGTLLPRADRPARWDLPGGNLPDLVNSFKVMKALKLRSLVPLQGPAIRGKEHVREVLERHLAFFEEAIENDGKPPASWPRPAPTALWLTPPQPWPLEEHEQV